MQTIGMPENILKEINRITYKFIWQRKYSNKKGKQIFLNTLNYKYEKTANTFGCFGILPVLIFFSIHFFFFIYFFFQFF